MQCPIDGSQLVMTERSGVEIDYCPQCRGVWLDRGELDKIIERSGSAASAPPPPPSARPGYDDGQRGAPGYGDPHRSAQGYGGDDRYRKKKRGGFLDELFDF
jgi:Zn-finger nucleic acid-binding protein